MTLHFLICYMYAMTYSLQDFTLSDILYVFKTLCFASLLHIHVYVYYTGNKNYTVHSQPNQSRVIHVLPI
jgi:hypothetical protein